MSNWVARILGRWPNRAAIEPAAGSVAEPGPAPIERDAQGELARGIELFDAGQYERAAECFEAAVELAHDWADAHYHLGLAQHRRGRFEDACDAFAMALCFAPEMARAHFALALAERKLGKRDAALASVARAIHFGQDTAEAHNLKGALLLEMGDVGGAVTSFEHAIAADPENAAAHSNLGYVLFRDCGDYEGGAQHIERALELDPANLDCLCNYTMVLSHRGEHERALALCDRLLSAQPELHEARLNRALIGLKLGRFESGWDDYESRKSVRCNYVARDLPWPEWRGESLAGKTILIHGEQGIGDEIMFASCFPELVEQAGHCVIECAPSLERLFRRSFPAASVFAGEQSVARLSWLTSAPAIDVQISAGSIPLHVRRSRAAFPSHHGYLAPDPGRIAHWRDRLATLGPGLKVGISWRGGMQSTRRSLRSIELGAWAPLLRTPNARFVSVQYGDTGEERARLVLAHGLELQCWQDAIDDMDETAALVSALDLVVSVCTAVIHLAGALGRSVWILVPTSPEWRYQAAGVSMPWYPSATMIRQQTAGDWRPEIAEAVRRLRDFACDVEGDRAR
ncbi:MAG: tetratricopeptide repeat protein [Betaproteobacteria bacterium]|nr:MAG: tetratricopeptide repeat protein [Betaproteobacteria bacterium]